MPKQLYTASEAASALGISLVVALVLNLALIPAWGLQGACWAALGGECIQALVLWQLMIRRRE